MQHKALFAAVFCGALCLTGCIKNIESESVTEVRKAKAQEIASVAKLNEAQASAATTLANAQAAISAAQAELIKAQAAKETAEAALIQAKADLEKVNVEIAKVKLEEEKVVLQQKKVELEKLIAQAEADIARAEAAKQESINRLNKAKAQAEIDQINAQKALIEAEKNLMAAANEMEAEKQTRLVTLWANYEQALEEVYDAQAKLIKKEVQAAQVKAGIQSGLEVMAEEAALLSQEIEMMKAQAEYLTQIAGKSYQEIITEIEKYQEEYLAADAVLMEAYNKWTAANEAWSDVYEDAGSASYIQPEFTNEWGYNPLQDLVQQMADQMGIEVVSEIEEGTGAYIWGIAPAGEFIPFWKDEVVVYGEDYIYPAPKDGIMPKYWDWLEDATYVPATIYYENYERIVNMATELLEMAKERAKVELDEDRASIEKNIAFWTDRIDAARAYVAEADKQIIPAREVYEAARQENNDAYVAYQDANNAVYNYDIANTTWAEYMQAYSRYDQAVYNDNDVKSAIFDLENITLPLLEQAVFFAKEAKFNAEKAVATQQGVVKEKKAAVTEAIVKAYEDAQAAVTKQEGVVEGKLNAYKEAVEAERAAELIYLADPDDATKKAAWETAKTATGKALNEYNAEVATLSTKMGDLATAKAAYDAVNDPYEAAVAELEVLDLQVADAVAAIEDAEKELQAGKDELAQLKEMEIATEAAVESAKAAKEAAEKAYEAYDEGTDPTAKALIDARDKAWDTYLEKLQNYWNARTNYYTILDSFNDFDYWSGDYEPIASYKYDYLVEYILNEDEEYSWINQLKSFEDALIELEKDYVEELKNFDDAEAVLANMKEVIEHYKAIEPVYNSWLVDRSAARTASIEAYKEAIDARNVEAEVEAKADALRTLISKYIYTDGDYWYDTSETIGIINEINAEIAEAEAELAEIQADMAMNYVSDEYNITVYANIMAKIEKLESKIEVYSALAEFYWAQIEEAMGGANVE